MKAEYQRFLPASLAALPFPVSYEQWLHLLFLLEREALAPFTPHQSLVLHDGTSLGISTITHMHCNEHAEQDVCIYLTDGRMLTTFSEQMPSLDAELALFGPTVLEHDRPGIRTVEKVFLPHVLFIESAPSAPPVIHLSNGAALFSADPLSALLQSIAADSCVPFFLSSSDERSIALNAAHLAAIASHKHQTLVSFYRGTSLLLNEPLAAVLEKALASVRFFAPKTHAASPSSVLLS